MKTRIERIDNIHNTTRKTFKRIKENSLLPLQLAHGRRKRVLLNKILIKISQYLNSMRHNSFKCFVSKDVPFHVELWIRHPVYHSNHYYIKFNSSKFVWHSLALAGRWSILQKCKKLNWNILGPPANIGPFYVITES